jgi:hypothetical protein
MRALLIPECIAFILLIAVLAYNFYFLPTQRRYFDDCNLRILKALTDQIRLSINAYDKMIDNAESSGVTGTALPAYLASVAPQLVKAEEDESRAVVGDDYGDPPKIAVASDEGTHFLYLAFKHGRSTRYTIRTDFEKLVDKLSPPASRCPFDAILIAQSDGTVIYQRSTSGIAISRINTLDNALVDEKQKKPESLITLDELLQSRERLIDFIPSHCSCRSQWPIPNTRSSQAPPAELLQNRGSSAASYAPTGSAPRVRPSLKATCCGFPHSSFWHWPPIHS